MSSGPAEDARGLGLWRDNAQLEAAGSWEADPAVSRAAAELALTSRWISLPASLLFVYSHSHDNILFYFILFFTHITFCTHSIKALIECSLLPSLIFIFHAQPIVWTRRLAGRGRRVTVGCWNVSIFSGNCFRVQRCLVHFAPGFLLLAVFLNGSFPLWTRVGIVTPVLQMLRDLNSVHFLCFTKEGHSMWTGKRNPVGTAISPVYFLY